MKPEQTLDQAIGKWSAGTLQCRGLRQHPWTLITWIEHQDGTTTLHQQCPLCFSNRAKDFDQMMRPAGGWRYPDRPADYSVTGGVDADGRAQIMRALRDQQQFVEVNDDDSDVLAVSARGRRRRQ